MVRFENVGMRYGAGPEVLRDISFRLEPGSFTFLTGLSGAGKTTLLKLIFLAEPPSRGLISLFGNDLATTRRNDFHRCLTEKLLTYAIGRGLEYYDTAAVDAIVTKVDASGGKPTALITSLIEAAPFQRRRAAETKSTTPSPERP